MDKRIKVFVIVLILVIGLVGCGAPAKPAQPLPKSVTNWIDSSSKALISQFGLPGISVGVRLGNYAPYVQGYGHANVDKSIAASAETVYRIASLTRTFTAAAILKLDQDSQLKLDDPAVKYLPTLPQAWSRVTIRQLITDSSGIPNLFDPTLVDKYFGIQVKSVDVLNFFMAQKPALNFTPGTQWEPSDTNPFLLGLIIEKVSGMTYGAYLQKEFIKPLGLTHTSHCLQDPPGLAQGYLILDLNLEPSNSTNSASVAYSAAGICSSTGDLLTWQKALASGKVLKSEFYNLMETPVINNTDNTLGSAYGYWVIKRSGLKVLTLGGQWDGFISQETIYPEKDLAIVLLSNGVPTQASQQSPLATLEAVIANEMLKAP